MMTTTFLLADDHALFRSGLRRLVETENDWLVVDEATTAQDSITKTLGRNPAVLLLDLAFRDFSGIQALRTIRERQLTTRVILVTASISRPEFEAARQMQVDGILLKESAAEALRDCIRAVLAGERWIDPAAEAALHPAQRTTSLPYGLTARELQIIAEICGGASNRDIAERFTISEETVKRHLSNIYDKAGVSSRLELAAFAAAHALGGQNL